MNFLGNTIPSTGNALTSDFAVDAAGNLRIAWTDGQGVFYTEYSTAKKGGSTELVPEASEVPGGVHAETATAESQRPAIALRPSDGAVAFVYSQLLSKRVFFKVKKDGSWGTPVAVGAGWETDAAFDASGNLHLVFGIAGNLSYASFDSSFNPRFSLALASDGSSHGPRVATTPDGTAVIVWETRRTSAPYLAHIAMTTIKNGVASPVAALTNDKDGSAINACVAVAADGSLAFAYQQVDTNLVTAVKLLRPGRTPVVVSGSDREAGEPALTFIGNRPFVAYQYRRRFSRLHGIKVAYGPAMQNLDLGWFPAVAAIGPQVFVLYRHAPLPVELRYRAAILS